MPKSVRFRRSGRGGRVKAFLYVIGHHPVGWPHSLGVGPPRVFAAAGVLLVAGALVAAARGGDLLLRAARVPVRGDRGRAAGATATHRGGGAPVSRANGRALAARELGGDAGPRQALPAGLVLGRHGAGCVVPLAALLALRAKHLWVQPHNATRAVTGPPLDTRRLQRPPPARLRTPSSLPRRAPPRPRPQNLCGQGDRWWGKRAWSDVVPCPPAPWPRPLPVPHTAAGGL